MDEKTFLYQSIKHLNEENQRLTGLIEKLLSGQESLLQIIDKLDKRIDQVSSPEYIRKVSNLNDYEDILEKVKFIKGLSK